jgi:transposase
VKAYVKRNKNDAADAAAICEAVKRPSMRFVPVKTIEQQSALLMHRARDLLIRQRTMLVNALRGHMAEFGLVEAQGLHKVRGLIAIVMDDSDERIPQMARQALKLITGQINELQTRIDALETQVLAWHKNNPVSQRLATIPGIGPIIATAIAATVADPNVFRSGREFAAWLGLVPRQSSTGGKARLGGISKRGGSLSSPPARQQRTHGAALFEGGQGRSLANIAARSQAAACRSCCLSKQDGTRGLGRHEQTRYLPARSSGSMTCRPATCRKLARAKIRDGIVGRPDGSREAWPPQGDPNPDQLIRPRPAESIKASGPCATAQKGRTHDRKRPLSFT